MKNIMFLLSLAFLSSSLFAANVSIIDSGVDYKLKEFAGKMWINPIDNTTDNRDQDGNGYEDDVYGWNFGNNDSEVIDYSYLNTFSEDPFKFFDIQGRRFLEGKKLLILKEGSCEDNGKVAPSECRVRDEDDEWLESKRDDKEFMKEMQIFGNFVHGTHVAGIAVEGNPNATMQAIKLLPTEVRKSNILQMAFSSRNKLGSLPNFAPLSKTSLRGDLMKNILFTLAEAQSRSFIEIGDYLHSFKMDVANGSFGLGYHQASRIIGVIYRVLHFGKKPSQENMIKYSKLFINRVAYLAQEMTRRSPNTLYVFAAGNDGLDNGVYGTSPSNIQADNSISVAATLGDIRLASFSNYSRNLVHIAAPGVIIESVIPGGRKLKVSGTSQASPYVANVAAVVKDANPKLAPVQIKKILMETVDKKDFLVGKVISEGIVNKMRALRAAELSNDHSIDEAIEIAFEEEIELDLPELEVKDPSDEVIESTLIPNAPLYTL